MRASRLVTLLLLLQNRGRTSARELAEALEVSMRTVFRDVEALSGAGVPVYAVRGPGGGFELLDGYRTELTGLSDDEAESLFLIGMPGLASELGLGDAHARVELKLIEALPAPMRARAERLRTRFHHDPWSWAGPPPQTTVAALSRAVWEQRVVHARLVGPQGGPEVGLEPLALVLKAGAWYLVAQEAGEVLVRAVEQFQELTVSRERFQRPESFDLAGFWEAWVQRVATTPRSEDLAAPR